MPGWCWWCWCSLESLELFGVTTSPPQSGMKRAARAARKTHVCVNTCTHLDKVHYLGTEYLVGRHLYFPPNSHPPKAPKALMMETNMKHPAAGKQQKVRDPCWRFRMTGMCLAGPRINKAKPEPLGVQVFPGMQTAPASMGPALVTPCHAWWLDSSHSDE